MLIQNPILSFVASLTRLPFINSRCFVLSNRDNIFFGKRVYTETCGKMTFFSAFEFSKNSRLCCDIFYFNHLNQFFIKPPTKHSSPPTTIGAVTKCMCVFFFLDPNAITSIIIIILSSSTLSSSSLTYHPRSIRGPHNFEPF